MTADRLPIGAAAEVTRRAALLLGGGAVAGAGIALVGGALPAVAATYTPPSARRRFDLNSGWRFFKGDVSGAQNTTFDDSSWQATAVPHTWNAVDGADGGDNYYQGVGWYRRHYTVPSDVSGKLLYLQFAGVNQVADVWVNGVHQGQHIGGYARFRLLVRSAFTLGQDNVIAVKVSNAHSADYGPQRADYTFMGGIYRNVSLWAVDRLQVGLLDYAGPGVYLRQRSVTAASARVDVTTKLVNNDTVSRSVAIRLVITDAAGTVVVDTTSSTVALAANSGTNVVQSVTISNPRRWSGLADPYQYSATVEVHDVAANRITDVVTEPLGLRSFSVDSATGFSLNGVRLRLHGVNLHQDRAGVGWATTDAQHRQDFDLLREIGATTVRLAHYQHDQVDYTLADGLGIIAWSEIPNIDFTTASTAYTANTETTLRELIRQNYNHPSIVFWGIGNEQRANDSATNTLLQSLADLIKAEDPERISTYASASVADNGPVNNHSVVNGYNKYFGWYDGTYNDLGAWADNLHSVAPNRKLAVSEYGAGASITQHALNPARSAVTTSFHPEEYQALLHEASWRQLSARPYIWGTYVWNMFDFASDARAEGGQRGINDKGLVTRDRAVRKDSFYWYKVNWASAPTLYITSRRWTQRSTAPTELKVYSNAATVTASLNGASLGSRTSTDHIFRWTAVTLRSGQNTVTVTATINGAPVTDSVVWNLA